MTVQFVGKISLSWLTDDFKPASPEDATLVKVIYPDGRVVFARGPSSASEKN